MGSGDVVPADVVLRALAIGPSLAAAFRSATIASACALGLRCPPTDADAGSDSDDDGLVAALRNRGLHVQWKSWDDPATLQADLVILRATWDYTERHDEFLAWTKQVRNLLNAPEVVAWNSDKRYLADLAAAGVPASGRCSSTNQAATAAAPAEIKDRLNSSVKSFVAEMTALPRAGNKAMARTLATP